MTNALKDREPDLPPELKHLISQIQKYGSDSLNDIQRMLVVQIFRAATMTNEPRVMFVMAKIQEAHLEYCFRLPALKS
jgi:hypothetical protein